jgi:hypothetical protein
MRRLVEDGPLQLSLFDERDLAEIDSPDYPGERLIVCRNPALAAERGRKRDELLDLTARDLQPSRRGYGAPASRCAAPPRSARQSALC